MKSAGVRLAFAVWLCVAHSVAAPNSAIAPDITNFHKVTENLFRGAQPSPQGLQELGAIGIKRVVDLRERGAATAFEEAQLKKLGIAYVNIPIGEFSPPTNDQIQAILKLIATPDMPTFIHCRRGKDRTGTVIACYRIQHDGWDNERALREARMYGMSSFERSMQHFVLHFTPSKVPGLLPALSH